jgi:hypothetical protein
MDELLTLCERRIAELEERTGERISWCISRQRRAAVLLCVTLVDWRKRRKRCSLELATQLPHQIERFTR